MSVRNESEMGNLSHSFDVPKNMPDVIVKLGQDVEGVVEAEINDLPNDNQEGTCYVAMGCSLSLLLANQARLLWARRTWELLESPAPFAVSTLTT